MEHGVGTSSSGQHQQHVNAQRRKGRRIKPKPRPIREEQITRITKVDAATGKQKVIEEISLLDSDDDEDRVVEGSESPNGQHDDDDAEDEEDEEEEEGKEFELLDKIRKDASHHQSFYRRFRYEGREYKLGDHVVMLGENDLKYVATVEAITSQKILSAKTEGAAATKKTQKKIKAKAKRTFQIKVRWFYQKYDLDRVRKENKGGLTLRAPFRTAAKVKQELYWSFDWNDNPITSIVGPAKVIYCPAVTDPYEMAAACEKEPSTFFCRYIYANNALHHIHTYELDWDDDAHRYAVQALYMRLQKAGVEFPEEEAKDDADFDPDADDEPQTTAAKHSRDQKKVLEIEHEPPAQKVAGAASAKSSVSSEEEEEEEEEEEAQSLNGMSYTLDSDTPIDDDDDEEEQPANEAKKRRRAPAAKERKRRKTETTRGGAPTGYVRLENISTMEQSPSTSPTTTTTRSAEPPKPSSSPVEQKLQAAAKAGKRVRKKMSEEVMEEDDERKELNKRKQQRLDEEMKKLSFRPRKKSAGKVLLINTPSTLPPDVVSTGDEDDNAPLDLSDTEDPAAPIDETNPSVSVSSGADASTSGWGSGWGSDSESSAASSKDNQAGRESSASGWGSWGSESSASGPKEDQAKRDHSDSTTSGWGSSWNATPPAASSKDDQAGRESSGGGNDSSASGPKDDQAGGGSWSSWANDSSSSGQAGGSSWGSGWGSDSASSSSGSTGDQNSRSRLSSAASGSSGGDDWSNWANGSSSSGPKDDQAGGGSWGSWSSSSGSTDNQSSGQSSTSMSTGNTGWSSSSSDNSGGWNSSSSSDNSGGWNSSTSRSGGRSGGGGGGGGRCFKCNESGHFSRECPNAGTAGSGSLPEVGSVCQAQVMSLGQKDGRPFGIFVRPMGCSQDGLVHFTQLSRTRVNPDTDDLLALAGGLGATVNVLVKEVNEENGKTRLKLSMKEADQPDNSVNAGGGSRFERDRGNDRGNDYGGGSNRNHSDGGGDAFSRREWNTDPRPDLNASAPGMKTNPDRARVIQEAGFSPYSAQPPAMPSFAGVTNLSPAPTVHDTQPQPQLQPQSQPFIYVYPPPMPTYAPAVPQSGAEHAAHYLRATGHAPGGSGAWAGGIDLNVPSADPPIPAPLPPAQPRGPVLSAEERSALASVPYSLDDINSVLLGRRTMMRWYRYDRMTFNTSSLRGLLVRVTLNGHAYVGEIVDVFKTTPYYFTRGYELATPPSDPDELDKAIADRILIRVTFKLTVEIPGVDEGREYPAQKISTEYVTQQEMAQWLVKRKAMQRGLLSAEDVAKKKAVLAKARGAIEHAFSSIGRQEKKDKDKIRKDKNKDKATVDE